MTKRIAPDTPAVYTPNPLNMGAFRDCPDEIIAQIIARMLSSEGFFTAVKNVSLVCKAFQWISNHPSTFGFFLDYELREKTTFIFRDFFSYSSLSEQRYKKTLTSLEVFTQYSQITDLEISGSNINDDALAKLIEEAVQAGCRVQSLKLENCSITKLDLSELKSLKELGLIKCEQLRENLDFTGLDQLQSLALVECHELSGLIHLLKNLKELKVKECSGLQPLPLEDLTQLKILKWKWNGGWHTGPSGFLDLKKFSQLETLELCGLSRLAGLLNLHELKSLKVLELDSCPNLPEQLDLDGLDQLEHLALTDYDQLTGLLNLSAPHQLKTLKLIVCRGLPSQLDLRGLGQLEVLTLMDNAQLTTLLNLGVLQRLQKCDLRGCPRLVQGVDFSALPSTTEITWDIEDEDDDQPPTA